MNRAALALPPGETRESLSFTEEVYARGSPSTSADGAGRTLPVSFGEPARAALAASHISGSPPGVFAVQRGATVCVTGVHWDPRLRNGAAGVVAAVEDQCVWVHMFADLLPSSTSAPPPVAFILVSVVSETSKSEHPDLSRELRRSRFPLSRCFAGKADASAGRTTSRKILDLLDPTISQGRGLVAMTRTRLAANRLAGLERRCRCSFAVHGGGQGSASAGFGLGTLADLLRLRASLGSVSSLSRACVGSLLSLCAV